MDRIERFFSNHYNIRYVTGILIVYIAAIAASFFAADYCAEKVISHQIECCLSVIGSEAENSDIFFCGADENSVKLAEDELEKYGIDREMNPKLIYNFKETRIFLFFCFSVFSTFLTFGVGIFGLSSQSNILRRIDEIREECNKAIDEKSSFTAVSAYDSGSLRNLSDSIEKLAYISENTALQLKEKQVFLKEFLVDFSHQLKTPCAVIRLNSELLENFERLDSEKREMLFSEIDIQLDVLDDMINESLKMARLDAKTVDYNFRNGDITELCEGIVRSLTEFADKKGVELSINSKEAVELNFDRIWLREAVSNIVKNSVEHSGGNKVEISISKTATSVTIAVEDNGEGIAQEKISKLFTRYNTRSEKSDINTSVGIGMSIAQKIVTAHSGEILVFSKLGEGTRFEIILLKR